MIRRSFLNALAVAALALSALAFPSSASANTLVENVNAESVGLDAPGQSLTTPAGAPVHHLSFNFFDAAGNPAASGTLFIFSQPVPSEAGLRSDRPGYVAQSTGIENGVYQFDASVTLHSNTQYHFYSTRSGFYSASSNVYAGGNGYVRLLFGNYVSVQDLDWCFRLSGTQVLDSDGDGIADNEDAVPNSDLRPFVDTGAGATTVPNAVDNTGTSLQDVINALYANARNRGQYVSSIVRFADDLRKAGIITSKQAAELMSGAAKAR